MPLSRLAESALFCANFAVAPAATKPKTTKTTSKPNKQNNQQRASRKQKHKQNNHKNNKKWDRYQQWKFMHDDILCVMMRMTPDKKQSKDPQQNTRPQTSQVNNITTQLQQKNEMRSLKQGSLKYSKHGCDKGSLQYHAVHFKHSISRRFLKYENIGLNEILACSEKNNLSYLESCG